jgi:hypothetical protein
MKKTIWLWIVCAVAFIFWKLVFSTDVAKNSMKAVVSLGNAHALSTEQITQIEEIARNIAAQSNANKQAMLDEMTVSFNAVAIGRNVRFENVLRVKKGLPPNIIKEWLEATRAEIIPKVCSQNANNPAFDRGLSYTFAYSNTYGEKLGDVFIDKTTCKNLGP